MPSPLATRRLPMLLGFLIAIGPVSVDMYLPAFPRIAAEFHDIAAPQYSLAVYFVGLAIGQMTQGALSDRLGGRAPLLAGLVLYTLASLGCALAWSTASFAWLRALAALGASAAVVIPRAMVRDLADGPAAAKLFSELMMVMGVAPIAAPMLGTVLTGFGSWRLIFALAALYGAVATVLVWFKLPDTLAPERRTRIGLIPVIIRYAAILRERAFITHALTMTFVFGALFSYIAASPQIFIVRYGWTRPDYAVLFGVNAAAYIGYNLINPRLVARLGIGPVISAAAAVLLVGCVGIAVVAFLPAGAAWLVVLLLICECGFGLVPPSAMVGALSGHRAHAGSAAALLGTLQYVGGAIAGMLVGLLADGTARPMAVAMLLCAAAAALAAWRRPNIVFAPAEN